MSAILPVEEAVDGLTDMIIKAEGGSVVMRFPKPLLFVTFDPANAVNIGRHLIDCAVACGADVSIEVPRRQVSKEQRDRLITRAVHVHRSMGERNQRPKDIATAVVDSILSAID